MLLRAVQAMALGVLGFLTPRILVGFGVPIDEWATELGVWLGLSRPWVEEWGLIVAGIVVAVIFSGIETWWSPARRVWKRLFEGGKAIFSSTANAVEVVGSSAPDKQPLPVHFNDKADLDEWRSHDQFDIWTAGYLWVGKKPHHPVRFDDPAYPSFKRLLNAAIAGQISVVESDSEIGAGSLVTKSELVRFAKSKGEMPEFLRDGETQEPSGHVVATEPCGPRQAKSRSDIPAKRDTWLIDAIYRVALGKWEVFEIDPHGTGLTKETIDALAKAVFEEIPQRAFDGDLPIWGKIGRGDLWKPIPDEYWNDHRINWYDFLKGSRENLHTEYIRTRGTSELWHSLKTSRAKVEQLWPVENT